jgi:hypothetical protein
MGVPGMAATSISNITAAIRTVTATRVILVRNAD